MIEAKMLSEFAVIQGSIYGMMKERDKLNDEIHDASKKLVDLSHSLATCMGEDAIEYETPAGLWRVILPTESYFRTSDDEDGCVNLAITIRPLIKLEQE